MESFRKAALGFLMALIAVIVAGAQQLPAHLTLESAAIYATLCVPEALLAPLFFPLALCYWGCGLSEQLAPGPPLFEGDFLRASARAAAIGCIFWFPWLLGDLFPSVFSREWDRDEDEDENAPALPRRRGPHGR